MKIKTYRGPHELAGDMRSLVGVPWSLVWKEADRQDPQAWCERFGWTLRDIYRNPESDFDIELPTGGRWDVAFDSGRVTYLKREALYVYDEDPEAVTTVLVAQWAIYFAELQAMLGDADILTSWDDSDFPSMDDWPLDRRVKKKSPLSLAIWRHALRNAEAELVAVRTSRGRIGGIDFRIRPQRKP